MKRLLFLLLVTILGGVSCRHEPEDPPVFEVDYAGFSYYLWKNESDHKIVLTGQYVVFMVGGVEVIHDMFQDEIQPGKSLQKEERGFINTSPPGQYANVMTVSFDDGACEATYDFGFHGQPVPPDGYDERYDPRWTSNYVEENVDSPNGCEPCRGTRWTYTFTNADYEAAKAIVEEIQEGE